MERRITIDTSNIMWFKWWRMFKASTTIQLWSQRQPRRCRQFGRGWCNRIETLLPRPTEYCLGIVGDHRDHHNNDTTIRSRGVSILFGRCNLCHGLTCHTRTDWYRQDTETGRPDLCKIVLCGSLCQNMASRRPTWITCWIRTYRYWICIGRGD